MWPNSQKTEDVVTFTEEIFNGKLRFLCSAMQTGNVQYLWYLLVTVSTNQPRMLYFPIKKER